MEDDGRFYLRNAQNFLAHGYFSSFDLGVPDADRPPVYPLFLAGLYAVVPQVWFLVIGQNILALLSVLVVYRISKKIFSLLIGDQKTRLTERLSFVVGLLFVVESERLNNANMLLAESLLILFFYISFYFFLKWIAGDKRARNVFLSGIFLGLAILTKPAPQAYILVMLLFIVAASLKNRQRFALFVRASILLVIGFVLVVFPWSARNKVQFGYWQISPLFPNAFWQERVLGSELYRMRKIGVIDHTYAANEYERIMADIWKDHPESYTKFQNDFAKEHVFRDFVAGPYLWADVWRYAKSQPVHFFTYSLHQTKLFFIDSAFSSVLNKVTRPVVAIPGSFFYPYIFWSGRLVWCLYYAIILAGFLFTMRKKKNWFILFVLASPIAYVALLNAFGATTRYRLFVNPFLFVFVVYAGFLVFEHMKEKKLGRM